MLKFEKIAVKEPSTKIITQNGRYNVADKTFVNVSVAEKDGKPLEVATEAEMERILANATAADSGKIYKYTGGTTANYTQNSFYVLEV